MGKTTADEKKGERHLLLQLYTVFFKIGAFTFGGGYAMLPLLEREIVNKYHWVTLEELMNYYAIGQSTPGVISVNTATFVGYKKAGIMGGIVATLGVISPSVVIITAIVRLLSQIAHLAWVVHVFAGVRVAVCALVLSSVWKLAKKSVVDTVTLAVFAVSYIATTFFGLSPLWVVLAAMAMGIVRRVDHASNDL